jgi:hypothetical protein
MFWPYFFYFSTVQGPTGPMTPNITSGVTLPPANILINETSSFLLFPCRKIKLIFSHFLFVYNIFCIQAPEMDQLKPKMKLNPDQVAVLVSQTTAAAGAAKQDRVRKEKGLMPPPLPPSSPATSPVTPAVGSSVCISDFPPPSERCKLIRIHRELIRQPTALGGAFGSSSGDTKIGNFHSVPDGRFLRSILIEDSVSFSIATASFQPRTWCCVSCSVSHTLLPKKRNISQWGGGRVVIILSDQSMPAIIPSTDSRCPAVIRVEGGLSVNWVTLFAECSLISQCLLAAF